MTGKKWIFVLSLALSAAFLGFALKSVDLRQSWMTLRRVDARLLLLPLVVTAVAYPLRALRWKLTFPPESAPDFWISFRVLSIGIMGNNFLPGRSGDLARCGMISHKSSFADSPLALGTLGVEKVLDGLMLTGIVFVSCWFVAPPQWISRALLFAAVLFGTAFATFVLLQAGHGVLLQRLGSRYPSLRSGLLGRRLEAALTSFSLGLRAVRSPVQMGILLLLTVGIWASEGGLVWAFAASLHIPISLFAGCLVAAVLGLGLLVPAAPGAVGTYEFFAVAGMQLVGVDSNRALTLAVLLHAWIFIVTSAIGFLCLAISGVSFRQMRTSVREA